MPEVYQSQIVQPEDHGDSWIVATVGYKPTLCIAAGIFVVVMLFLFRKAIKTAFRKFGTARTIVGLIFILAMAVMGNDSNKPTPPPVVTVQGIEITEAVSDANGLSLAWDCTTNIVVGVDRFQILYRERQIPSRTGWSAWRELGSTMETSFRDSQFMRNRDIQLKVQVTKELE